MIGAACLVASASLVSCTRSAETPPPRGSSGSAGGTVGEDLKGVAQEAGKTAKDVGRATADLADRAGKRIEEVTDQAGAGGDDAWITTKVKSALTAEGVDPLHVHVDTAGKVVTLSGTVETAADVRKAVSLARAARARKFGPDLPKDWKERSKQARFLQYRGFSTDHIRAVLEGFTGDPSEPDPVSEPDTP